MRHVHNMISLGLEEFEDRFMPPSISSIIPSTLPDTYYSRTFSPELEVAGGAGSSTEASNFEAACERVVTTSTDTSLSS